MYDLRAQLGKELCDAVAYFSVPEDNPELYLACFLDALVSTFELKPGDRVEAFKETLDNCILEDNSTPSTHDVDFTKEALTISCQFEVLDEAEPELASSREEVVELGV